MPDFNIRSDSVNVEQIMEQIRARIREKRGVDYTEQELREMASVKLEKFLDPKGVRSDLLKEFRQAEPDENYAFEDDTLFETHRGLLRLIRRMLRPVLKLFFNPNPIAHVLHLQSQINDQNTRRNLLYYELIHNLVLETTRLGIEVKNLKMRVESLSSRVEFNERRARALESAVVYRPTPEDRTPNVVPARAERPLVPMPPAESQTSSQSYGGRPESSSSQPGNQAGPTGPGRPAPPGGGEPAGGQGPGQRSRRRRRRRGRRGGGPPASAIMGGQAAPTDTDASGGPGSDGPGDDDHSPDSSAPDSDDRPSTDPGDHSEQ